MAATPKTPSELILYQTEDGKTRVEVRLENETVWLTQKQIAELFQKDLRTVNEHIQSKDEIEDLNLIVSMYLDFAELQAKNRKLMTMQDWLAKLDGFLRLSDRGILTDAGKVSHDLALSKAGQEYQKFRVIEDAQPTPVEVDFEAAVKKVKELQAAPKEKPRPGKKAN